ncbi:hypothetical protein HUO13_12065 [Saccharopolyspora erythraea]|uniref:hypothetical protein n=1 Tax=Saccharopolyspora erythraea TaxID=1836 RepID=UPI001BAC1656|nr:hypothetical protein [Saccharopolyspora erythraea]QUH01448.1 hypothetical protein HUO13_12065 [Saccharopolyspora erythraea]
MAAWHSDPEAAREYIRQHPEVLDSESKKPGAAVRDLSDWSPTVELLTTLVNEIRGYRADYAFVSAQGKGGRRKPDLLPGPRSALEAEIARQKQDRLAPMRRAFVPVPPVRKD